MPSSSDFFHELQKANTNLTAINVDLNEFKDVMEFNTGQLVTLTAFTNGALSHQVKQLDTIICLLKQIADHTCRLLNESHTQTGLQTGIAADADTLTALYAITHAEAALVRQREEALQAQIEACCPPKAPEPACKSEKCAEPGPFEKPPIILKHTPKKKARDS